MSVQPKPTGLNLSDHERFYNVGWNAACESLDELIAAVRGIDERGFTQTTWAAAKRALMKIDDDNHEEPAPC